MYRVVLVDDEIWVINGLLQKVCWKDYFMEVVGTATDGIEAVKLTSELNPHIVVTDLRMPGIDGLSLIKTLKESDDRILFIILTGFDYFTYTQKALRLGVFDYLLKPIDPDNIEDVLIRASKKLSDTYSEEEIPNHISNKINEKHVHAKVSKVIDYINDYYQQDLALVEVAEKFETNPSYLSDIFSRFAGVTFSQYISNVRIEKAKQLLHYTNYNINTISLRTGFKDYHHFVRSFKRIVQLTPTEYRAQVRKDY